METRSMKAIREGRYTVKEEDHRRIDLYAVPEGEDILWDTVQIAKRLDANVPPGRSVRFTIGTNETPRRPGVMYEGITRIHFVRKRVK